MDRVLPWLWNGRIGTPFVSLIASATARYARKNGIRSLVDEFAGVSCENHTDMDFDDQFIAGFATTADSRDKIATFIEDLSTLDPCVRKGLLRTWIRIAGLGHSHRQAQKIRDREAKVTRFYPLEATITPFGSCNLRCTGCYTADQLGGPSACFDDLDYIVTELRRLHVTHVLLVGKGEPFFDQASRDLLFGITRRNPNMLFSVYTNGTLIQEKDIARLRSTPNLVPLISIDGFRESNDTRRGLGVFQRATDAMRKMKQARLFFGYISTVFRDNQAEITSERFVAEMAELGCRFGMYSMFLTMGDNPYRSMRLLESELKRYNENFTRLQKVVRIPLLDIDGVESHVGCRAKHGSTVFIDALAGQVAPCIRQTISPPECNLFIDRHPGRLAEILASPFFTTFRAAKSIHTCPAYDT